MCVCVCVCVRACHCVSEFVCTLATLFFGDEFIKCYGVQDGGGLDDNKGKEEEKGEKEGEEEDAVEMTEDFEGDMENVEEEAHSSDEENGVCVCVCVHCVVC